MTPWCVGLVAYIVARYAAEIGSTERLLAVGLVFVCIALLENSFERLLVTVFLMIGFGPLFGWFPGMSDLLDPIALIVAFMLGFGLWKHERVSKPHVWSLSILSAIGLIGLWFWQIYWRVSPGREPLSLLINGWDHVAHFNFYSMSTVHDSFLSRVPRPEGVSEWFTERYPAGIQMFWAQLSRVSSELRNDTDTLLIVYGRINVINMIMILVLGVLAVIHVMQTKKASLQIAVSLAVVGFVLVGPLSISLTAGYPNFGITCAALFAAMAIIVRPLTSVYSNAVVVNGVILVCAYNWFPSALIVLIPSAAILIRQLVSSEAKQRVPLVLISVVGSIGSVIPILQNLRLGTSHLSETGGIPLLSPMYPVLFILLSVVLSLANLGQARWLEVVRYLGVPIGNFMVVLAIVVMNRIDSGGYPYYSQKILYLGTAVSFMWSLLQLVALIERKSRESPVVNGHKRQTVIYLLAGFSALQIWGYVGPDYSVLAASNMAPGLDTRGTLDSGRLYTFHSLAILRAVRDDQQLSLGNERPVLIVDSEPSVVHPILLNYWPGVLLQRFSSIQFDAALKMGNVAMVPYFRFDQFVDTFSSQFVPYEVDIVTTKIFADALVELDSNWSDCIFIYSGDDSSATIARYSDQQLVGQS